MLTLLLVIPLIGSLLLLPFDSGSTVNIDQKRKMRQIALITSIVNFIVSIVL